MNELKMLQQRQQLLEQAARLQRATIMVRLHSLQKNRWSLLASGGLDLARRLLPASSPLLLAWRTCSWLLGRHRGSRSS